MYISNCNVHPFFYDSNHSTSKCGLAGNGQFTGNNQANGVAGNHIDTLIHYRNAVFAGNGPFTGNNQANCDDGINHGSRILGGTQLGNTKYVENTLNQRGNGMFTGNNQCSGVDANHLWQFIQLANDAFAGNQHGMVDGKIFQ